MNNKASNQFTWYLEAFERQGHLWLKWSSTSNLRAHDAHIRVYSVNDFPKNPEDHIAASIWSDNFEMKGEWDTGLTWGGGWPCAIVAERNAAIERGQMYVVQVKTIGKRKVNT